MITSRGRLLRERRRRTTTRDQAALSLRFSFEMRLHGSPSRSFPFLLYFCSLSPPFFPILSARSPFVPPTLLLLFFSPSSRVRLPPLARSVFLPPFFPSPLPSSESTPSSPSFTSKAHLFLVGRGTAVDNIEMMCLEVLRVSRWCWLFVCFEESWH